MKLNILSFSVEDKFSILSITMIPLLYAVVKFSISSSCKVLHIQFFNSSKLENSGFILLIYKLPVVF